MSRINFMDSDGENLALRSFLLQWGLPSLTVGMMRQHMARSGWGAAYCPPFVNNSTATAGEHLTKAGAQICIRHLLSMEPKPAHCSEGNACLCGGDTKAVRASCPYWKEPQ